MVGTPAANGADFGDVGSNEWFANGAIWANANNIINGSDGNFNPNGVLPRGEMALALNIIAKLTGTNLEKVRTYGGNFVDIAALPKAQRDAIITLYEAGIVNGSSATAFGTGSLTRAEFATFLHRLLDENVRVR